MVRHIYTSLGFKRLISKKPAVVVFLMLMKKAIEGKEEVVRAGELVAVVSDSEPVGLGASKLRAVLSVTTGG